MFGNFLKKMTLIFKPLAHVLFFRKPLKVEYYQHVARKLSASSMVEKFNMWHSVIFSRYFRKVMVIESDLKKIRALSQKGPVVFVMKNRGRLEYRYFNHLFLKERLPLIDYSNKATTVFWRPFDQVWAFLLGRLNLFFQNPKHSKKNPEEKTKNYLKEGKNILLNIEISRNYLFGLFHTDPTTPLQTLIQTQREINSTIGVLPMQFLFDKDPERSKKSLFDVLFGDKSSPGSFRKLLLFVFSWRKRPQVKFGNGIDLKQFLGTHENLSVKETATQLLHSIEEDLSIERARITGPKLVPKDQIIADALADESFQKKLQELAHENKISLGRVKKKAKHYFQEIAANVNYSYVHLASKGLDFLFNHLYDGLVLKYEQLNKIRELAGKNPLVLVPMHRSHIDYLVISYLFYKNNISFPHVCAGKNLNFWPVGRFIRKCGGFFIRRNFEGNDIYKETLYSYLKTLLAKGHNIEFYIEGTRSRTGKMLKPKLGILGQFLRAFLEQKTNDIHFVPIAINYDHIIEQKAYQAEGHGKEKKKENTGELLKVRKVFGKKYGKVYIEFGDPLSLKNYFKEKGITAGDDYQKIRSLIPDFGYYLTQCMNKIAIVTPISLVSTAILSLNKKTFSHEELISRLHFLKNYLDYKDVVYSDLIHYNHLWAYNEAIEHFKSQNLIKEIKTFEGSFYAVEDSALLSLDYYKNNIVHFFVSLTCFCKILAQEKTDALLSFDDIKKKFELLKTLFEFDFTFSASKPLEEHLDKIIVYFQNMGLVQKTDNGVKIISSPFDHAEFEAYQGLCDNFLESQLLTLRFIKHNRFQKLELKPLIKEILQQAKPLYLKGDDFKHPESLMRFNIENSLKFCEKIGILKSQEKNKLNYSVVDDAELIEKWIDCVAGFLKTNLVIKPNQAALPKLPAQPSQTKEQELH